MELYAEVRDTAPLVPRGQVSFGVNSSILAHRKKLTRAGVDGHCSRKEVVQESANWRVAAGSRVGIVSAYPDHVKVLRSY